MRRDQVEAERCIDRDRVWLAGLSMGGFMGARLACDLPGRFAAVGAVAGFGVMTRTELLVLLLGGLFVIITASVILQVGWFKISRKLYGTPRRLFQMTPIHHHFELKGWKESQVIVRFWILGLLCAMVALGTLKLR